MEVPEVAEVREAGEVPERPEARTRRRGRTTLLIATAAVLGLVAGTCAGFLVQADREPTRLPSLSQSAIAQAKGDGPEPLSAAQDRKVKTDGDLRKLLVKRPRGTRESDSVTTADGWEDVAEFSEGYTKPDKAFANFVDSDFRRAAVIGWQVGRAYDVEVQLVQYHQEDTLAAADASGDGQYYAMKERDTDSWSIPGTGDGTAYVHNSPDSKPGYLPLYEAEAHAWRGDIALHIYIYDSKPIPKKAIMDLAERQMGRL